MTDPLTTLAHADAAEAWPSLATRGADVRRRASRRRRVRAVGLGGALVVVVALASVVASPGRTFAPTIPGVGEVGFDPASALLDGHVSEREYRASVDAATTCLSRMGWDASVRRSADGVLWTVNVGVPSPATEADLSAERAAQDRCYAAYTRDVERAYFWEQVPTGAERDAMLDSLLACLRGAGIQGISRADTEQDLVAAIAEQQPGDAMSPSLLCIDEHRLVFPDGMFGGRP